MDHLRHNLTVAEWADAHARGEVTFWGNASWVFFMRLKPYAVGYYHRGMTPPSELYASSWEPATVQALTPLTEADLAPEIRARLSGYSDIEVGPDHD